MQGGIVLVIIVGILEVLGMILHNPLHERDIIE